jgi:hypothetical protein
MKLFLLILLIICAALLVWALGVIVRLGRAQIEFEAQLENMLKQMRKFVAERRRIAPTDEDGEAQKPKYRIQ